MDVSEDHRRVQIDLIAARLRNRDPISAAVVGAGRSGRAAVELLRGQGASVEVLDDAQEKLRDLPDGSTSGPISLDAVNRADLVVLSPGVPRARLELSDAIADGRLVGETELASWFVDRPLVGITGTNGKSTTTALVGHILAAAGRRAFVGGNLGMPLSELVVSGAEVELAVLELSSYQLESIETARFRVGAWLNLQPDHLDRYPSLESYAAAKARLVDRVEPAGWIVASATDPVVAQAVGQAGRPTRWFAVGSSLQGRSGTEVLDGRAIRGDEHYSVQCPGLLGRHNHENAAAAIEITRGLGVAPAAVQDALSSFVSLPHRLAVVHEGEGVRWYDDSKATNVDSALTAVRAMTTPTVLIAGGRDKGGDWEPLVKAAQMGPVTRVLAIGEAAELVERCFGSRVPVERVGTLRAAVDRARDVVPPGGAVLLAPACASFDQFDSYVARGEAFARLARGERTDP